ncbi:MAG: PAS domain-containing sensor histidine kinase [bacterium]|nr:PAS domain-containing sensor histidine kinase [bacterium]
MIGKKATSEAQLDQERLNSLVNSMADGVIATDQKGEIVLYNGAAMNILDRNTSIKGKKIGSVISTENTKGEKVNFQNLVVTTETQTATRELKIVYEDESTASLYTSIAPVHLGYGKKGERGFVILLRDITHEKSLEDERNEFISVVSHELRTPIAITEGMIGNAEFLIEKTGDIAKSKELLKEAHAQVLFLAQMINDLSTLSRAERGKLQAEREAINVSELITELHHNYEPGAAAKGLMFFSHADPSLEALFSSRLYVREILQNFITNAIKYTESGSITLEAKPSDNGVDFTVTDTGIGIGQGDKKKVFGKFFRADNSKTREQSGTGLGLYVTAKLAHIIGATINLDSQLHHGSTFIIHVPNL